MIQIFEHTQSVLELLKVPLISAGVGAVITFFLTNILNKSKKITYTCDINRVALSSEDYRFGKIQVIWQDSAVPKLFLASFNVENSSYHDFENVPLRVWCGPSEKMLTDKIRLMGTTFEIGYTDEFKEIISVPVGLEPTESQKYHFRTTRDFFIPVYNRGGVVVIQILFFSESEDPMIYLDCKLKGARLIKQFPQQRFWGEPIGTIFPWTIFSSVGLTVASAWYFNNKIGLAFVGLIIGLFGQVWGAVNYKLIKRFRNLISM